MFTITGSKFFFPMTAKSDSLPLPISSSDVWNPSGEKCENHPLRSQDNSNYSNSGRSQTLAAQGLANDSL
jgi:hypothetical protein